MAVEKMSFIESFLDLLFPPKCPFCRTLLEKGELWCPECQRKLPWLVGTAGERKVELTGGCASALHYEGTVRKAIHRYKFSGVRAYSKAFGVLTAQAALDHGFTADLVSWPSVSKKRLRERGYDQGELLAREVGRLLSVPVQPVLEKTRHTAPQSELEENSARQANARGAYALLPEIDLTGKRVVLVDDVVTSGATLSACAALLRQAGAAEVYCLTLAQARR